MEKVKNVCKAWVIRHQVKLVVIVQILLCLVYAKKSMDKEMGERFKLAQKFAKKDRARKEKLQKQALAHAKKVARAKNKIRMKKLTGKYRKAKIHEKEKLLKQKNHLKQMKLKLKG